MSRVDAHALRPEVERVFRSVRDRVREVFAKAPKPAQWKDDGTLVTALDHELEERLAGGLLDLDASWGLVSEEGGAGREGSPTWRLDPLDGTLNFSRRLPLFVCQAALVDGTDPLIAVIYDPLRDDFVWAAKGEGAERNGERLQVPRRRLREALVFADIARSGRFVDDPDLLPRLRRSVFRMRALGSIGMHLREVAFGGADAFFGARKLSAPLHDVAPGVLIAREAGAKATNLEGDESLTERRTLLVAAPSLHAALMKVIHDR